MKTQLHTAIKQIKTILSCRCLIVLAVLLLTSILLPAQPASVPYTWKRVEIGGGGFVTGIVFHPNYTNVAYCRTDVGGAYRWNEQTGSWEPLLNWFSGALGVEEIAVDPNDPNMVYLTVGEDNWAGHDAFLVSSNRGTTWTRYTPPFGTAANNDGRSNGPRMMVDPNNTSILFYAAHSGLYKSTNRGMTWSLVGSFPVTTTTNGVGPNFVQFIKSSGTNGQATPKIFVGVSQANSKNGVYNLYYSSNGGTTWTGVNTSAADSNAGAPQMPHRAAQDGLGNMYVTFSSGPGPNGVASGSVLKINVSTLATTVVTPPTGQGGFAGVSVSRQNPNVVAVSTIDRWWPHDVIYLSTDGGASWPDTTQSGTMDLSSAPWWAWGGSVVGPVSSIGHWIGDCQIDPFRGDRMFFIGGGGMTAVTNLLSTSRTFYAASTGIEEMGGTLSVPSSGPLLYSYFWDIGGFTHYNLDVSPDTTNHFTPIGGSITCGDHAELKPWMVVRVSYGLPTYGAYSTDYGASWTNFGSCPSVVSNNGPNYIAVSASGSNLVWTPWSANQYWSGDKGTTWTPVVGGTTNSSGYFAISDRASDADFYIYNPPNGTFYRSSNGGRNFAIVNSSLPTGANTPATVFGRAGDIWLPSANGLYHSTSYGSNWVQVLTGVDVCKVAFGKAAPGASYPAIYIGAKLTDPSIYDTYRSIDGGANWVRINDDQHRFGVYGNMRGDPNIYGRVYRENRCYGITYADIASNMPVNNVYELVNRNSGLFADNGSDSMSEGVQMVQSSLANSSLTSQQWMLENLGGGKVKLVNQLSGLVLGVAAGALNDGAPVIQSGWANTDNQKWLLTSTDSGYYKLINVASGKALAVAGGSVNPGAALEQQTGSGSTSQQWGFAAVAPGNLVASAGDTVVTLNWAAVSGAISYDIKRATTSGGPYTTVASGVTGTSYANVNLLNGTTYYYVVCAVTEIGEGPASNEASGTPAPRQVTAWYALEGNAQDSSGNGNNGTATSITYVAGKIGSQAAQFNGSSSYIQIPRAVSNDFTVMMWVKTTDSGNSGSQWWSGKGLVDAEVSGNHSDWGTVLLAGKFAFGVGNPDTTISSSASINDGVWHHVAATRNNSSGAMKVYVDGVLSGSGAGPTGSRTDPPALRIGGIQAGGGFLNGIIDEVRLYTNELGGVEISALAGNGPAAPPVPGGLAATGGNGQVALSWTASSGATSYNVKRATTSGGPYTTISSPASAGCTDTSVVNGTTYYYVVSALNAAGAESANSSQVSAIPGAPPPSAPTGLVATAGNAQAALSWNAASGATSYNVKRATVNGGPYTTVTNVTGTSYSDTGLVNGTTYYYVISALNAGGESANSSQVNATPQVSAPSAPTGLTATAGNAQAALSWNAASGATSYNVKRATVNGGPYTTITNVTGTSYSDTGLANGTTYYYVVSALNAGGESANSAQVSATPQVSTPPAPTGLVATAGEAQVGLTWTASSGATSYNVKRATVNGGPYSTIANVAGTSYADTGLSGGTTYYYVVSAVNAGGESANSTQAGATPIGKFAGSVTGSPGSWGNLGNTITNAFDGNTNTFYDAANATGDWAAEDLGSGVAGVVSEIKYCPRPGYAARMVGGQFQGANVADFSGGVVTLFTVAAAPQEGVMTVQTVTPGTAFRYLRYIGPTNGYCNVAEIEFWGINGTPPLAPSAPTGLAATAGNAQVALSWNAASGATSYNVKRATTSGGPYTSISNPASPGYTDASVVNGTTYYYVVSAVNTGGESANSGQVSATPQVSPPPAAPTGLAATAGNAQAALSWNAASGATSYNVKRATVNGGPYTTITNVTGTSYSDTGLVNGTTYYYVVSAVNAGGESANSTQVSATPQVPPPATPTGLAATSGYLQMTLSWSAASGATSYNVKRATTSGGPYSTLTNTTATGFVDNAVVMGTTYYYVVSALNAGGESANSAQVSGTSLTLPSPWSTQDIGAVGIAGSAVYSNSTYTVTGSGTDTWGTADQFRFVYQTGGTNCSITAKVLAVSNSNGSAKGGVMIRETLATNAMDCLADVMAVNGVENIWRKTTGGSCSYVASSGLAAPYWVRVTRSGSTFIGYRSSNGTAWTPIATNTITMANSVKIGLFVCSHNNSASCTATFTNVVVSP